MKKLSEVVLPEELYYTDEHVWVRVEEDSSVVLGITDYAQDQLGEIVFIDLPEVDSVFEAGGEFGTVESLKSVNSLFMPVSGRVIETNATLESSPTLVNADCYGRGWMLRIRPDNGEDVGKMPRSEAYRNMLESMQQG